MKTPARKPKTATVKKSKAAAPPALPKGPVKMILANVAFRAAEKKS